MFRCLVLVLMVMTGRLVCAEEGVEPGGASEVGSEGPYVYVGIDRGTANVVVVSAPLEGRTPTADPGAVVAASQARMVMLYIDGAMLEAQYVPIRNQLEQLRVGMSWMLVPESRHHVFDELLSPQE